MIRNFPTGKFRCHSLMIKLWISEVPRIASVRLAYMSVLLFSMILQYLYSAAFTGHLTVLQTRLPYSSYLEFLKAKSYKVVYLEASAVKEIEVKSFPVNMVHIFLPQLNCLRFIHHSDHFCSQFCNNITVVSLFKDQLENSENFPVSSYDGFQKVLCFTFMPGGNYHCSEIIRE